MGRVIFILFYCFSVFHFFAQQPFSKEYRVRDSLVDDAMQTENYALATGLIAEQIDLIQQYNLFDSLYHYCYNYGRAKWKTKGPEMGIDAAIKISNEVKNKDADILHYLQTLNDLSWLYYETGNVKECLIVDSTYLALCLENEGVSADLVSMAYYNLGFDYLEFGKYSQSLTQFQHSIEVILNSNDSLEDRLSMSYNALGAVQWRLGELDEARKSYEKSLALIAKNTDPKSQLEKGNILGNIALILHDNGELIKAKDMQEEFISIDTKALPLIKDPYLKETALRRMTSAYINLADIYFSLGDYSKSRRLIDLAISERKKLLEPDDPSLAGAIEHLAYLEMQSGNYTEAEIKMLEYLSYCREYFGEKSAITAQALKDLGNLYLKTGNFQKSEVYFKKAIESQMVIGNPVSDPGLALIYRERSDLFLANNQPQKASADLRKSMEIYSKSREEDNHVMIGIYLQIAEINIKSGELSDAKINITKSVDLVIDKKRFAEQSPYLLPNAYYLRALLDTQSDAGLSANIAALNDLELAIEFLKTNKQSYLDEESKLMFYDAHKKIFELAERTAIELYSETSKQKWLDTFFRLTEENRTILLRNRLQNFSALDYAGVPDSVLALERKLILKLRDEDADLKDTKNIVETERQYDSLLVYIQNYFPDYYILKYLDKSYSIADVQKELINESSSLLVFSMTSDHIYILLIDREKSQIFKLPCGEVKTDIMKMNHSLVQGDTQTFDSISRKLYHSLFEPMQPFIKDKELFIVPDEDLFFLNFEILPNLAKQPANDQVQPLIYDYTISYFLSATVALQFNDLHEDNSDRLLTFAPGFTDRQKVAYQQSVSDSTQVDQNFLKYIQQPFAVKTAQQIAGVFSGEAFLEDKADETTFKREAGKYGILHLGTHAEVNENAPLMSHLVLSKNINNDSLDDGYLHAYEIYQMPLRAELAVLTACETGVGRQQSSEGIISLAHSFAYSGCPSIVMSLWNIDEKTSAGIINDFYHYLSRGISKNQALREAKLNFLKDAPQELQSPYYWAGLVLLGDSSPVNIKTSYNWPLIIFIGFLAFILLVFLLRYRKKVT